MKRVEIITPKGEVLGEFPERLEGVNFTIRQLCLLLGLELRPPNNQWSDVFEAKGARILLPVHESFSGRKVRVRVEVVE